MRTNRSAALAWITPDRENLRRDPRAWITWSITWSISCARIVRDETCERSHARDPFVRNPYERNNAWFYDLDPRSSKPLFDRYLIQGPIITAIIAIDQYSRSSIAAL